MQTQKILNTSIWPRWAQHILFWTCLIIFFAAIMAVRTSDFHAWLLYYMGIMFVFIPQTYITAYWLIPKTLKKKSYLYFILLFVPLNMAFALFELLLSNEILFPQLIPTYKMEGNYIQFATIFIYSIGDSYPMLIFLSVKYLKQWAHTNDENRRLEEEKTSKELHLLHNKLDPPLLLRTLQHLQIQAEKNDPEVSSLIINLADFLSTILYDSNEKEVPLEQEIELVENYTILLNALPDQKMKIDLITPEIEESFFIKPCLFLRICEVFTSSQSPLKIEIKIIRNRPVLIISGNTLLDFCKVGKELKYLHDIFKESFLWNIKESSPSFKVEIRPLKGQKKASQLPFTTQGINGL